MTTHTTPDAIGAIALLDEPTRRRLYDVVAGAHSPVGRDEAAAIAGISRELAAFHLDRLVKGGLLETEYRHLGTRRGPGAGRPAKLYRPVGRDVAVSLPQRDYARAADVLAEALERVGRGAGLSGGTAVAEVARSRGEAAGLEVRSNVGSRPSRRRLRLALMDLLKRAGYVPEVELDWDQIRLRSCPYKALVDDHRDLTCGMNIAWADGVIAGLGDTGLTATLDQTDGQCCVVFDVRAGRSRSHDASQVDPAS